MINKTLLSIIVLVGLYTIAGQTLASDEAKVYFISPQNGEVVQNPVTIKMGLKGMGVAPAGVNQPNTGHHHLIIDAATPDLTKPIPKDENHRHFGGGQTETTIELAPGQHTLQLIVGDFAHVPHTEPVVSEIITITIK